MHESRLPSELLGVWSFERTVCDSRAGASGGVVGELVVSAAGDRLLLRETGVLTWAGRSMHVARTTYLELREGEVWAMFADGRPFHPWRPGEDVVHPCAADTYTGRIDLDGDAMHTTWCVTGPAKDQLLTTELRRR